MNKTLIESDKLNWEKVDGLIPAIIQDVLTLQVLMLGYMNKEALRLTQETGKITFYSRTKQCLWTKGEVSGHDLTLIDIVSDCDSDTLLLYVKPNGPCCHLEIISCFGTKYAPGLDILSELETIIEQRYLQRPLESYVTNLFNNGVSRIAQKVGEEGVELALASVSGNQNDIIKEAADLLFHLLVLLKGCNTQFKEVLSELKNRMKE